MNTPAEAPKRPSKNARCPCGSGKKYRKCHGRQERAITQAVMKFKEEEEKRKTLREKHGHARPPMSIMFGGKRVTVIGSSIYKQTQEGAYSFMNVLHDCGLEIFGTAYLEEQERRPLGERHPALQWMYTYVENRQRLERDEVTDLEAYRIGAGGAWFRFGYDLFTIRDNAKLQTRLSERLLDVQHFQGARHELAVAAICVAAGYELDFEDEADRTRKHPEFIGTDKLTGAKIAVEAKSRHRRGVKGFMHGRDVHPGEEVGIRGLVVDGFQKESPYPFYLFVDVNLPPAPDETTRERWLEELWRTMGDLAAEGYANPCPANAVFFTNDPSHYILLEPIGKPSDSLWFKHFEADAPRVPHPAPDMASRFLKAFTARIAPPEDFPDWQ
jgi:hypothetical protein